jgi:hypothetical protein
VASAEKALLPPTHAALFINKENHFETSKCLREKYIIDHGSRETKKKKLKLRGLYRPSDRRLPANLVLTFGFIICHVVSAADSYGRILGFLDHETITVSRDTDPIIIVLARIINNLTY